MTHHTVCQADTANSTTAGRCPGRQTVVPVRSVPVGKLSRTRPVSFHKSLHATGTCRSPIEMSPASPIEMSLGHAVVETFGVTSDGGDPDERARTDPVACADRSGGQPADSRGGWHLDGRGATSGLSPAPCFRIRRTDGVGLAEAWSGEQSPASRDVSSNRSDPGPAALPRISVPRSRPRSWRPVMACTWASRHCGSG